MSLHTPIHKRLALYVHLTTPLAFQINTQNLFDNRYHIQANRYIIPMKNIYTPIYTIHAVTNTLLTYPFCTFINYFTIGIYTNACIHKPYQAVTVYKCLTFNYLPFLRNLSYLLIFYFQCFRYFFNVGSLKYVKCVFPISTYLFCMFSFCWTYF